MSSEMTTIEVTPEAAEVLRALQAQAEERRMALDVYLRVLAEKEASPRRHQAQMSPAERAKAWEEWVASHSPDTPVILDDSREALYADDEQRWAT
jgi:hypothetical protein